MKSIEKDKIPEFMTHYYRTNNKADKFQLDPRAITLAPRGDENQLLIAATIGNTSIIFLYEDEKSYKKDLKYFTKMYEWNTRKDQ